MMENTIDAWSRLKNLAEETTRIPIAYIMFIFLNILIYLRKGQTISSVIISNLFFKGTLELLLGALSVIYDNILVILITVFIIAVLIVLLFEKTKIFGVLPEDIEYVNGEVESWNPVSAANRLLSVIFNLSTFYFVYYTFLLFVLNPNYFYIKNNWIVLGNEQKDFLLNLLWNINYIALLYFIARALFVIKYKNTESYLKFSYLRYNIVSEFDISNDRETVKYLIVKDTYNFKQYYLLECKTHKRELKETKDLSFSGQRKTHTHWEKEEIPILKRSYHILDKTENLSDIVYYYDELRKKLLIK